MKIHSLLLILLSFFTGTAIAVEIVGGQEAQNYGADFIIRPSQQNEYLYSTFFLNEKNEPYLVNSSHVRQQNGEVVDLNSAFEFDFQNMQYSEKKDFFSNTDQKNLTYPSNGKFIGDSYYYSYVESEGKTGVYLPTNKKRSFKLVRVKNGKSSDSAVIYEESHEIGPYDYPFTDVVDYAVIENLEGTAEYYVLMNVQNPAREVGPFLDWALFKSSDFENGPWVRVSGLNKIGMASSLTVGPLKELIIAGAENSVSNDNSHKNSVWSVYKLSHDLLVQLDKKDIVPTQHFCCNDLNMESPRKAVFNGLIGVMLGDIANWGIGDVVLRTLDLTQTNQSDVVGRFHGEIGDMSSFEDVVFVYSSVYIPNFGRAPKLLKLDKNLNVTECDTSQLKLSESSKKTGNGYANSKVLPLSKDTVLLYQESEYLTAEESIPKRITKITCK